MTLPATARPPLAPHNLVSRLFHMSSHTKCKSPAGKSQAGPLSRFDEIRAAYFARFAETWAGAPSIVPVGLLNLNSSPVIDATRRFCSLASSFDVNVNGISFLRVARGIF